jgi:hypothetical protein
MPRPHKSLPDPSRSHCSPKSRYAADPRYECGYYGRYVLKPGYRRQRRRDLPKPPPTPFIRWMMDARKEYQTLKTADGIPIKMPVREISQILARDWENGVGVTDDEKDRLWREYHEELEKYRQQIEEINPRYITTTVPTTGHRITGYILWLRKMSPRLIALFTENNGVKPTRSQLAQVYHEEWSALSSEEKDKWHERAIALTLKLRDAGQEPQHQVQMYI